MEFWNTRTKIRKITSSNPKLNFERLFFREQSLFFIISQKQPNIAIWKRLFFAVIFYQEHSLLSVQVHGFINCKVLYFS